MYALTLILVLAVVNAIFSERAILTVTVNGAPVNAVHTFNGHGHGQYSSPLNDAVQWSVNA